MYLRQRRSSDAQNADSRGFTVVELLVCLSVIGLITAIVLPAVLRSRAAARQVQCKNNVRNLGLALNSFVGTHRHFPVLPGNDFPQSSAFLQLLPYLDESNLYQKLLDAEVSGPLFGPIVPEITTGRPSVLVCPEDGNAATKPRTTCYATNEGWPIPLSQRTKLVRDGVMYQASGRRGNKVFPQAIRSGLSNTAAIAEIVTWRSGRGPWTVYGGDPLNRVPDLTPEAARETCLGFNGGSGQRGRLWSWFYPGSTGYNHVMLPNEKSCIGAWGSASRHGGGVQVSLCDGSVRFVSDSIDPKVWLVLGSRIGGSR